MDLKEVLNGLGLEKKEIDIYLALLELGEAAVLQISKKSGIKRPTAYVILRSLEEKGFISKAARGKKTFYFAQHPKKLLTEAEFRLKELKETLPQLESLFRKEEGRPRIMTYEGREALDRAYDEWFITKGEAMYMGTLSLSREALPKTYKKMEYVTFSPEFSIRELITESDDAREYKTKVHTPYRQVRFLPQELLPFEVDVGIFGNRTIITSVKKEYFTISIESSEITKAFCSIFEIMWQAAKE